MCIRAVSQKSCIICTNNTIICTMLKLNAIANATSIIVNLRTFSRNEAMSTFSFHSVPLQCKLNLKSTNVATKNFNRTRKKTPRIHVCLAQLEQSTANTLRRFTTMADMSYTTLALEAYDLFHNAP